MTQFSKQKKISLFSLFILVLIVLDQLTKKLAVLFLKGKPSIPIIPNVFELHYLENTSAAFGVDPVSILHRIFHFQYFIDHPEAFLHWKMVFFTIFTVIIVILLYLLLFRIPNEKKFGWMNFIIVLFIAGAVGNLIDRITINYVVDFFYFRLIDFPIFNVADIYVTVGAFLVIVLGLFYYKEEDLNKIFPPKDQKKGTHS